jgi:hypothetical protein
MILSILFLTNRVLQLMENAAYTPNVDGLVILLLDSNDFRRTVPSGANVI